MAGIDMRLGPIHIPIHLRNIHNRLNKTNYSEGQKIDCFPYSCSVAEHRCRHQEMLFLGSVSVDSNSIKRMRLMVDKLIALKL
jgi:hypothetical protein